MKRCAIECFRKAENLTALTEPREVQIVNCDMLSLIRYRSSDTSHKISLKPRLRVVMILNNLNVGICFRNI